MYDHEEHVRGSYERKSGEEEDRFGVCWGAELLDGEETESKKKSRRQFSSFYRYGRKYRLDDTVYLLSGDEVGPAYIGRIGQLYENIKDKKKQMQVRWFCRPCEMPLGLPGVDYSKGCKEVFMMWGDGAKNINNPASTLGHCSVLCTAKEGWNRNVLSFEEIAAADHIFDRAYDLRTGKLLSLDSIVKHHGEHLVTGTGTGRRIRAPGESDNISAGIPPPLPLAMRASADLPPVELDWHRSGLAGLSSFVGAPKKPSTPVEGHKESLAPKLSASALNTARHESNKIRSPNSKDAEDRTIPKIAKLGLKRKVVQVGKNNGTVDSPKKPRVDRSDSSLPQQNRARLVGSDLASPGSSHGRNKSPIRSTGPGSHGNVILSRDGQKVTLHVAREQMASEDKKRSRANSPDQRTEKGIFKKPKSSIAFHAPSVATPKEVSKVESKISLSRATCPKMGELRSPKVPERTLPENSSGWHQARQSPSIKNQDGRVSSAPVTGRNLGKDENLSNRDQIGNLIQVSPSPRRVKAENAEFLSPKDVDKRSATLSARSLSVVKREAQHDANKPSVEELKVGLSESKREGRQCLKKQSTKEENGIVSPSSRHFAPTCSPDASSHQRGPEDVSPTHRNGANLDCTDLEQDTKLFRKSSAHGLERRGQPNTQDDVNELNTSRRMGQNSSTSNHVLPDGDISPTSTKNRHVSERNCDGTTESRVKCESVLSSKRSGSCLEDSRYTEVGSPHIASKKRPGSELEASTQQSKFMRHSDSQPVKTEGQQVREELKVKKIGSVPKNFARVSSKKQSDQIKQAETSRLPPQGLVRKVVKVAVENDRISEPGLDARKDSRAAGLDATVVLREEEGRETFEPKKKIFNFPWEDSLRIALEQGKALFLQNLDPWFSSVEIEADLQELLRVSCDVRMLPPKNFTCYTSGQALVLFPSHIAAKDALRKFTENLLIWSKDERPVLASLADAKTAVGNRIHGFYNTEFSGSRRVHPAGEDKKNGVATSHCSQPNTIEYEMGIQWRLLQDRHTEAWTIAAEDQKAAIDRPDHGRKPKSS